MEARLFRDPRTDEAQLYVWEHYRSGERVYFANGAGHTIQEGGRMEPALTLPWRLWPVICAELVSNGLAPVDPGNDATKKHLDDAITLRDRLLSLIEKKV